MPIQFDVRNRQAALAAYEESLGITRRLAAADPGNANWQRDLSVDLNKIGNVRLALGDRSGALFAYGESLGILRKLAASDPGNSELQSDIIVGLRTLAIVSAPPQARQMLQEAVAILEMLVREGRLTAARKHWAQMLHDDLAKLPATEAAAR
jgi:tetratricopeptide (TPR) repeat protein